VRQLDQHNALRLAAVRPKGVNDQDTGQHVASNIGNDHFVFAVGCNRRHAIQEPYLTELDAKHEALSGLAENSRGGRLTLLIAARDPVHNNAVALREYLLRASKMALCSSSATRQHLERETRRVFVSAAARRSVT
jgi:hypothetical protein